MILGDGIACLKKAVFVNAASTSRQGEPDSSPLFLLKVEEPFIYLVDYSMTASARNLRDDPKISLSFMNMETLEGYRFNGTAQIIESGQEFQGLLKEYEKKQTGLSATRLIEGVRAGSRSDHFELEFPSHHIIAYKVRVLEAVKIGRQGDVSKEDLRRQAATPKARLEMIWAAAGRFSGTFQRALVAAVALSIVVLVSLIRYGIGHQITFSLFYLVPIILTAMLVSKRAAAVMAFVSAMAFPVIDLVLERPFAHSMIPWWNGMVRFGLYLVFILIYGLWEKEKMLSNRDYLTGVANRRSFNAASSVEIERSRRYKHPLSIIYLDCDDFKSVNDRMGHHEGDRMLRQAAECIHKNTRSIDLTARLGGDEFAVLLPETGPEGAQSAARKIQRSLTELTQRGRWPVTFSLGAATYIEAPESVDAMIRRADEMMYAAKQEGKSTIRCGVF